MRLTTLEQKLQKLIAIASVTSDHAANQAMLAYVNDIVSKTAMFISTYDDDGYQILVATTKDTMSPDILLVAHADVVSGPEELFTLQADKQNLYGRGVLDMKFAIAAYLELIESLGPELQKYNFGIAITTDEETRNGNVSYLLNQGYAPKSVVLPDGSSNWQLESLAKGAWTTKVTVTGKASHGSRPWEGESATFALLDLLQELRDLFGEQGPHTDTLNISLLDAGETINQIPEKATAAIDIRVLTKDTLAKRQREVQALYKKYNAAWEVATILPPLKHDLDNQYIKTFGEIVGQVTGKRAGTTISHGASEAVRFHEAGIPCIVTSPEGGGRHANDEWVSRESLQHFVRILKLYLIAATDSIRE